MIARARRHMLDAYAVLALGYLFLPIAIVIAFSFNNPLGRFNYTWQGFTFKNRLHPLEYPGLGSAIRVSLEIAVLSSIVATVLGTLIALALVRYRFRGSGTTNLLIFIPMATPEIVMGASLLTLFLNWRFMDLGANEVVTFFRVTLPLIAPGILAAGLLAFALSIDDFVITYFNAGTTTTFPLFVWGAARVAVPPQINVVGAAIFVIAIGGMLANVLWQNRRARLA
jgi:spermidine/putrescine transport system permease protein